MAEQPPENHNQNQNNVKSYNQFNYVDQLTLECLMNKDQYSLHMKKPTTSKKINNSDRKFYKKRIYDLTKQLLNNQPTEKMFPDVVFSFESYIKACIDYFKVLDKSDILQQDYQDIPGEESFPAELNTDHISTPQDADQLMLRSIKIQEPNALEKLVKRTSTKLKKPMILPREKDINLKDPNLKNKGIRKKNNINNKYEDEKK
uniref:Uncharacterized protein n=1 Tax=viral metagenome TaxID=1070528 RepID=A0A6C0DGN7_9ZZZZ